MKNILFVCLGNICRSPSAEGIARAIATDMKLDGQCHFDSAGTHDYHIGKPPDSRAIQACADIGVDISSLKARQFTISDFELFDLILPMDMRNLDHLEQMCQNTESKQKLVPLVNYIPYNQITGVPDPFRGTEKDFREMVSLLQNACKHLVKSINHEIFSTSKAVRL